MIKEEIWLKIINDTHSLVSTDTAKEEFFFSLLGRGYFPRQLPPPFQTSSFESAARKDFQEFTDIISTHTYDKKSHTYKYSLARPGQLRRTLGIPNPALYYLMCLKISSIFSNLEIDFYFDAPNYSLSFPTFQKEKRNRAFEFLKGWEEVPKRKLKERAKGKFIVTADIARFFPSIYTHSIPWALHGKSLAKRNRKFTLDGNFIDLLARNMQDGQTLGLPIGPDTSFILSEKILTEIDKLIEQKIAQKNIGCFHRVDDYEFVTITREDADFCLAAMHEVLSEYELELNTLKTSIKELPQHIQDPEVAQLRSFDLGDRPNTVKLLEYYDLAFACYKNHPKGTLKYAIKRLPTKDYYDETISDFMAQSILLEPGVIEAALNWLTKAECINKIDRKPFVAALCEVIREHSVLGHSSEVAWAIWGFLLMNEAIPAKTEKQILQMNDSAVLLLALDARDKGLFNNPDLQTKIDKFMKPENIYSTDWLLCYEAVAKGWVAKEMQSHIKNDPIFNYFKKKKISFYKNQSITTYKRIMKNWQPYNLYGEQEDEPEDLPF